jgi:hypothetical protein
LNLLHTGPVLLGSPLTADAGPVLLVHPAHSAALEQRVRDCRTVATVDNGHGTSNMEQHATVALCSAPDRP